MNRNNNKKRKLRFPPFPPPWSNFLCFPSLFSFGSHEKNESPGISKKEPLEVFIVFWFKKECFGANPSFKFYRCAFFLSSFCIVFRRSIGCSGSALEAVDLDVSILDFELLDDKVADFDTLVPLELNDLT